MTQLGVHFKRRDFGDAVMWPQVRFTVKQLRWRTPGGPEEAIIEAKGPQNALWELLEMLRCPVQIHERGEPIWWGFVESATVRVGVLQVGLTLETMANRICVLYAETNMSGVSEGSVETSWIQDDLSVSMFGTKEQRISMQDGTAAQAAAYAARALAEMKNPQVDHQWVGNGESTATLVCRGWWDTLAWKYYANTGAKEGYEEIGNGLQTIGKGLISTTISFETGTTQKIKDSTDGLLAFSAQEQIYVWGSTSNNGSYSVSSTRDLDPGGSYLIVNETVVNELAGASITVQGPAKCAQSFQCAGGMAGAATIRLRVKREGTPADNLVVSLCADNAGVPGTVLASCTTLGTEIDENLKWHTFQLNTRVDLIAATTYWIVIERSGALDPDNYYKIDTNEDCGYTSGAFRITYGGSWLAATPDVDLVFSVGGQTETTAQLVEILNEAQFITAIDLECNSGIYAPSYRDGKMDAGLIVEDLLESGGPNGRRLHATVDVNRRVRIYEEPTPGVADCYLYANGALADSHDRLIETGRWTPGVWATLKDVIPDSLDLGTILNARRVFIERVIYDANSGTPRFMPRVKSVLDVE